MKKSTNNLKDKVVNRAVNSLRRNKRIEQISFAAIAKELNVSIDEIPHNRGDPCSLSLSHRRDEKTGCHQRTMGNGLRLLSQLGL